jgi:stalled ribosome rescue protein Dom34
METKKNIGIWMDHSTANIIDLNTEKNNGSINSKFTTNVKEEVLDRSEYGMHNKEEQMNEAYYKEISEKILKYNHVLLFGPTNAKTELHNYLNKDLHFKDIKIDIAPADKMTINEKNAFVKNHFNN